MKTPNMKETEKLRNDNEKDLQQKKNQEKKTHFAKHEGDGKTKE